MRQATIGISGDPLSVRVCVLGSGSRGNSTLIATERTRLLVDAGFSKKETYARLASVGESLDDCAAIIVSHEHSDHINGLRALALDLKAPIYISPTTRATIQWDSRVTAFESFTPGARFTVGDIEVTPFSVPHDAAEPVAFTLATQGLKIGLVTDLGYVPELVKQHLQGCHCLIFESNHDLEMLKVGPYPWNIKQRVMSRTGHLSNTVVGEFLADPEVFDGLARYVVLAHLSEQNNNPDLARITAQQALESRPADFAFRGVLHIASQRIPLGPFEL